MSKLDKLKQIYATLAGPQIDLATQQNLAAQLGEIIGEGDIRPDGGGPDTPPTGPPS
jgi:hypothetical protein